MEWRSEAAAATRRNLREEREPFKELNERRTTVLTCMVSFMLTASFRFLLGLL